MTTKTKRFRFLHLLVLLLLLIVVTLVVDFMRISRYEILPMKPKEHIDSQQNQVYYELVNDTARVDWSRLDGTLKYISGEYDCSDFRLVNVVRILYEFGELIPEDYLTKMEEVLFNFRYWWDEPGENSMCYWSENHQILFASAEYLIGQRYPDSIFPNSGLSGRDHMEKARIRALDWLEMRWKYGFIEFYSSTYYQEDIAALINLIDFAGNEELVKKSRIILDLLFYDLAAQNIGTMFISASGRAYESNRKGGSGANLGGITEHYWGSGKETGPGMMYGMMLSEKYQLPPVLAEIARDSSRVVIRQSNGLDLSELKPEEYYGTDNRSMMMQWGMEAFTNPEVVRNSLAHIRNCRMFSNEFIGEFKVLDFTLLKWLHLEPAVVRIINPQTNGVAIQKGNTYTFKTKDYSMYTAQKHQPGDYGDQQHVFGMNIRNHFSIFHSHPALEKGRKHQSPNYWVGYGHFPHAAQDEHVNLSIYNIPEKKGMMELELLDYTFAYFPEGKFDSVVIDRTYAFGKKGESYCAMVAAGDLAYRDNDREELIQHGKQSFWITEAGSKSEDASFESFMERIRQNKVDFNEEILELQYESKDKNYRLKFGADFTVNGEVIDTQYDRYDSPYVKGNKKDQSFTFEYKGKSLSLDFHKMTRNY